MLRRKLDEKETVLTCEDLTLDLISWEVYRNNLLIELTTKEFDILEYLLRNKGRVLTKSQIAEHVWNYEFDYKSNIIEVYIRYLRKKIDDKYEKKLIITVRNVGYKLTQFYEKSFRKLGKNFITKIPVTKGGPGTMKALIPEDMAMTASEVIGISQVIYNCEMYQRVLKKCGKYPPLYFVNIIGIFDEYLVKVVKKDGIDISTDLLW